MGRLYRLVVAAGIIVVLGASAACGGGDAGATQPQETATARATATSAAVATATSTAAAAQPSTAAPSATAALQPTSAPATVAAPLPTAVRATPTSPPPAEQSLTVVAKDVKFVPASLSARAGAVLHLTLDNQDAGVPHDLVLYTPSGAVAGTIGIATGPIAQTMAVTLGAPGRYAFKCSVHPTTMNGSLAVT